MLGIVIGLILLAYSIHSYKAKKEKNAAASGLIRLNVVRVLLENGPCGADTVQAITEIPLADLMLILSDETTFHRVNGKWDIVESLRVLHS